MKSARLTKRRKLYFLFSSKYRYGGSTVMRGKQLSVMAKKNLRKEYDVKFVTMNQPFKDSYLFFTKMAMQESTEGQLIQFKKDNNKIFFDVNDGKIDENKIKYADSIVVSSSVGSREYKKRYPNKRIILVDHHVDPRIKPLREKGEKRKEAKIGYFGELTNTIVSERIAEIVDVIPVNTASQNDLSWIKQIRKYNVHYAVRKKQVFDDFKPATKVFTAAYMGANVIIQDTEEEAVSWLGQDYPYIIKGGISEDNIIKTIQDVRSDYGNEQWSYGLEVMAEIKNKLTEDGIMSQLRELLEIKE